MMRERKMQHNQQKQLPDNTSIDDNNSKILTIIKQQHRHQ
jgi:hypothetical protein